MGISDLMGAFLGMNSNANTAAKEPTAAPNGVVPGTTPQGVSDGTGPTAFPAVPKESEKAPMADYADMWKASDSDKGEVDPTKELAPAMTLDPAKLQGIAKGIDFSKAISPDVMEKIKAGDSDAMLSAMNQVGQAGFAQALTASAKLIEKALQVQATNFQDKVMPDILRKERIGQSLNDPIFDNPAVKPMLDMAVKQLSAKHPTATPAEITQKAKDFTRSFAEAIAAGDGKQLVDKPTAESKTAAAGVDWEDYLAS